MNSGRSSLSTDRKRILFAIGTFNSGKATPINNMPDDQPLYVSPMLAEQHGLKTNEMVRVIGRHSGGSVILRAVVSDL